MNDFLNAFLSSSPFIPHGHCYLWKPSLVWLHLISDALIAVAYYSIPLTLFYFVRKRTDLPFNWIFLLFASFIVACGTTHIAAIWTLWYPTYWVSGTIKAATATVSIFTAIQLVPLVPKALALPSAKQLEQSNLALQTQIQQRLLVEEELRQTQSLLEQRVQERTAALTEANGQLQQEIRERQRTEAALRTSVEQLELALTTAKMGNWTWDVTTDIVVLSEAASRIFGVSPGAQITWTELQNRLGEECRDRVRLKVLQALEEHEDYDVEYPVIRASQEICWVAAKGRAQYNSTGQAIGMLGVVQDITDRKQAEIEREQLLERERIAREQAETANRVKDEFLAVLSHELRTPLNPILGWTSLLKAKRLDAEKTAFALDTIARNAKLQTQLIDDLLDISRILRGKLGLDVGPVDLAETIEAAIEAVALAAEAKSIQIQTKFAVPLPSVMGDSNRLQQVVWNLLTNSVKFTPQGGQIWISLDTVDHQAQITVQDTGRGIQLDFLPHVFEYFRQADSSTTRSYGGLGLGLAIVRQIVELHGGTVQAKSDGLGTGATFVVQIPLLSATMQVEPAELPQREQMSLTPNPLAHLQILLVDDEPDARELAAYTLEQWGAQVRTAASAQAAIAAFQNLIPDLLISDIGMPEMDGYQLLNCIRNLKVGSTIPAIALTAYAGEANQQQAIAAGFQLHLSKPIDPEALLAAVLQITYRSAGTN